MNILELRQNQPVEIDGTMFRVRTTRAAQAFCYVVLARISDGRTYYMPDSKLLDLLLQGRLRRDLNLPMDFWFRGALPRPANNNAPAVAA